MQIKNVGIQSSELTALHDFYQSKLGLVVEADGSSRIKIKIGASTLYIDEAQSGNPFYHFAINIPCNKIEQARSLLVKSGIELLWMEDYESDIADFRNWHAKSVYFFDPAGNIVELIARFDLRNEIDEPFSAKHFLSISEIGLVFPENEIEQQVEYIFQRGRLSYFLKQPPMQHFKVVGDDEGLFIIVTEHRNWYPTNVASHAFPLEVSFENDGCGYSLLVTR